jgi:hypothetical protein
MSEFVEISNYEPPPFLEESGTFVKVDRVILTVAGLDEADRCYKCLYLWKVDLATTSPPSPYFVHTPKVAACH